MTALARLGVLAGALRRGYGWPSLLALGAITALYGGLALKFPFLIDLDASMDWLLAGIWTVMTLALLWDPRLARDGKLIAVGFVGGLVIETWGTQTELWRYYTAERPPPWILPAWPIAAIAIDRLARGARALFPWLLRLGAAYWLLLPAFAVAFAVFMRPAITHPTSLLVLAVMLGVILVAPRPRRDAQLFITGAFAGIFLEYWGTSRGCWTYWNRAVPPVEAVLAHGFATVAFARGVQLLEALGRRARLLKAKLA